MSTLGQPGKINRARIVGVPLADATTRSTSRENSRRAQSCREPGRRPGGLKNSSTPTTAKPGRPTRLTPEVQVAVLSALRAGATRTSAAEAAGIGRATLLEWLARGEGRDPGREGGGAFADFAAEVRRVEGELQAALVRDVRARAEGTGRSGWRAAAWLLERRFPRQWGQKSRAKVDPTTERSGERP